MDFSAYFKLPCIGMPPNIPSATVYAAMKPGAASRIADDTDAVSGVDSVACPKCNATLAFHRSKHPHIDASGFESYDLKCDACDATLAGVIDPSDDSLLLSAIPDVASADV